MEFAHARSQDIVAKTVSIWGCLIHFMQEIVWVVHASDRWA